MSHDTVYYNPASYAQAYGHYNYDQTAYGQTVYDYTQATTQATTLALTSKSEDTTSTSQNLLTTAMLIACILVTAVALVAVTTLLVVFLGTGYGFRTETQFPDDTDAPSLPSVYPVLRLPNHSSVMTTTGTPMTTTGTPMVTTGTPMTTTGTTMTPTASTLSPRLAPDEQPLVCTMGSKTSFAQMFPPDGLCEYIFFDSVEKDNRNPLAFPKQWGNDLRIFVASYVRYNTTAFGVGFAYDKAFGLLRLLNTTSSSLLQPFWRKNIFHFGILDTATRNARPADVDLALQVLKVLDTHAKITRRQGNASFIFFAGVAFNNNWTNFYAEKFRNFYKPDLFIAQGHYFYGDNTFRDCRVMPPTALSRPTGLECSYQHDLTMAVASLGMLARHGPSIIWALSVTMKGRWTMTLPGQRRDFLSSCVHNTSAPSFGRYSEICRNPSYLQRIYSQTFDAVLAIHDTDNVQFAYDSKVGLRRKLCSVKALHPALRFGIVVYDVEYEDFLNKCGASNKNDAFSRLRSVRGILNYFRTRFNSSSDVLGCRQLIT